MTGDPLDDFAYMLGYGLGYALGVALLLAALFGLWLAYQRLAHPWKFKRRARQASSAPADAQQGT
jgi:hypothetical protein